MFKRNENLKTKMSRTEIGMSTKKNLNKLPRNLRTLSVPYARIQLFVFQKASRNKAVLHNFMPANNK